MAVITRKTDQKGRLLLFSDFADHLVLLERVSDDEVRVRKAKAVPKRASLDQLLEGVTDDNLHAEVNTGPSVGNESW